MSTPNKKLPVPDKDFDDPIIGIVQKPVENLEDQLVTNTQKPGEKFEVPLFKDKPQVKPGEGKP